MSAGKRLRIAWIAFFDQLFFFLAMFALTYVALIVCEGRAIPAAWFGIFVAMCFLPMLASAIFAAQLAALQPPPVERRDRHQLREIRPQELPAQPAADDQRRAA